MKQRANALAFADVPRACRDAVVTAARARWKERHSEPSDRMLRMLRFVWMRNPLSWDQVYRLHGGTLGACLRAGLLVYLPQVQELRVTMYGERVLDKDRRRK